MFSRLYGPVLAPKMDRLGTYAAALAYGLVLSLIPFLIVTFTLGSALTHENLLGAYADLLADIFPREGPQPLLHERAIATALNATSHGGIATLGFCFAIYTSFNLMTQIVRTLLFIFDDHRRPLEWNSALLLKTMALSAIWMLLLLLLAAFSVVTPIIRTMLVHAHLDPRHWTLPMLLARDVIGIASLFGAFFLTYSLVCTRPVGFAALRNGSLFAALGWALVSLLFATVIPGLWRTNAVYQALGSIVIVLLWAQACAWMVILGACWIVRFPGRRRK